MMPVEQTAGVIGGSGQLGGAIARAWLRSGCVPADRLWISNRSGNAAGFEQWPEITVTTNNQELVDACQVVLLSVPPDQAADLNIVARDQLVLSVMAGVCSSAIVQATSARRVVRAMSNPAADLGLAYSPWCAGDGVSAADRDTVRALFKACGEADEVFEEDHIDRFTALTGPVPGFVAYFAECMVDYATHHGIDAAIANRAMRQLFKASGAVLGASSVSPADHVDEMIAYAGTTAAGLQAMKDTCLAQGIADGLDAAYERTRTIAGK